MFLISYSTHELAAVRQYAEDPAHWREPFADQAAGRPLAGDIPEHGCIVGGLVRVVFSISKLPLLGVALRVATFSGRPLQTPSPPLYPLCVAIAYDLGFHGPSESWLEIGDPDDDSVRGFAQPYGGDADAEKKE